MPVESHRVPTAAKLAGRVRFGYRWPTVLLVGEVCAVNHKCIYLRIPMMVMGDSDGIVMGVSEA
jgi:hypothetical protein